MEVASGSVALAAGPEDRACLHLQARSAGVLSWRTSAVIPPGRYIFEALLYVKEVKNLPFGIHRGAGLRVVGRPGASEHFDGTGGWKRCTVEFQVQGKPERVEFECELRASGGEAWFDCQSLRVVRSE